MSRLRTSTSWLNLTGLLVGLGLVSSVAAQDASQVAASSNQAESVVSVEAGSSGLEQKVLDANKELDRLAANPSTEKEVLAGQRSLVEVLEATLRAQQRLDGFQKEIEGAEAERLVADRRLELAEKNGPKPIDPASDLATARKELLARESRIIDLGEEQASIESLLERREARRVTIRSEATEIAAAIVLVEAMPEEAGDHRNARIDRLRLEARGLEIERRAYDSTDETFRSLERTVSTEIEVLTKERDAWQARVDELAVDDVRRKLLEATDTLEAQSHPLLQKAAQRNREMAERLVQVTDRDTEMSSQLLLKQRLLDRLRRGTESDQRRFTDRVTPSIATVLRQRDTALPETKEIRQEIAWIKRQLPAVELERLLLEDELSMIRGAARSAEDILDDVVPPLSEEERAEIRPKLVELLNDRLEIHGRPLLNVLAGEMEELQGMLEVDAAVLLEIERYRSFVLEQTVWVRDPSSMEPGFWSRVLEQSKEFFSSAEWWPVVDAVLDEVQEHPLLPVLAFGPGLALLLGRGRIQARVRLAGERVARAETDQFRETLLVAAIDILQGLAFAGPFWLLGEALSGDYGRTRVISSLDQIIGYVAIFVLVLATMSAVVSAGGLAEKHFRWSEPVLRMARRLVFFSWVAVVFGVANRMCDPRQLDLPDLGRLFFSTIPILIAALLLSVVRSGWERSLLKAAGERLPIVKYGVERLVIVLIAMIPLIGLVLANIGWYEAVSLIQRAVVESILFLFVLLVLREVLFRGLHARMRKQSWLLRRQREGGADTSEEVDDLEDIGVRMRNAIRFCVVTALLIGLWGIWDDLLPAFQILRGEELWTYRSEVVGASADGMTPGYLSVSVTLGDLLLAIGTLAAALYAARNLPTVVEIMILDRVGLQRGVKYAVAQLIQWVLVISGVTAACALIGVTWSSVQWLAAGFTVGLGFGLQEIFANFISGLIILFEQPVRVGDVVTVGETTGQISRIRMRSTTITDWDRKELIVPNKQFITTEVVNWSIGESCIRLVLPVGVSYSDDPEVVSGLLLDIGVQDPGTLADPEPSVSFTGFGESSLDFKLRVYLADTDSLVPVRNRINIAIKKAFDERGISIPFPQRDVHVSMVDRAAPEGAAAPISSPSETSREPDAEGGRA